jgi:mannose-6-phosphate isomerase-like protein (cupin superfamily)
MAIAVDTHERNATAPLWFLDTLVTPHVPRSAGADRISVLESLAREGDGPPLHVHHDEDEVFFVLEGRLRLRVGDSDLELGAGEAALGPRSVPHTYRVESEQARWLVITAGAPFEQFVRSLARPAAEPTLPPASGTPDEAAIEVLTAAAAKHGIEFVGPPLG